MTFPAAAFAVTALAFLLRVLWLDRQSLWYDEAISVVLTGRDLGDITQAAAADIHPPLYYYLLHFWTGLFGNSEFSARLLSAIFGTLLVVVVLRLTWRLFGRWTGIIAGLLTATSPFLIHYSQEARMYQQVTLFAGIAILLYWRLVSRERTHGKLIWVALIVAEALTLYSHYFGFTVVLLLNIHFVLASGRLRKQWLPWFLSQAAVVIIYLPWLIVSFKQLTGWPSISEAFDLPTLLARVLVVFSWGLSWDATATTSRILVVVAFLALALVPLLTSRRDHWRQTLLVALYGLVPVLTMYVLSLSRPMFNPKFLLLASPALCIGLAVGSVSLAKIGRSLVARLAALVPGANPSRARTLGVAAAVVIAVASIALLSYANYFSLKAYYTDPKYARDDYRGLVQSISSRSHQGDVIILTAPGQAEVFEYYYHGDVPVVPLPRQRPIDEADAIQQLEEVTATSGDVWLVLWAAKEADPNGRIEGWLDTHMYKSSSSWFGSIRLCRYVHAAASGEPQQVGVKFGDLATLEQYQYGASDAEAGQAIPVELIWQVQGNTPSRYAVFAHLLDESDLIVAQRDSEPVGGTRPTSTWQQGETITDRIALPVLVGTPPGQYTLELGMYDVATGQRLALRTATNESIGDRVLLPGVTVKKADRPADASLLEMQRSASATFDGKIKLIGYSLTPLGKPQSQTSYSTDDLAHIVLYWQLMDAATTEYDVVVDIVREQDQQIVQTLKAPLAGRYAVTEWQIGEIVRDQHKMGLAGMKGNYYVEVSVSKKGTTSPVAATGNDTVKGAARLGALVVGQ